MADALFEVGRKLMKERRWEEACPKLAESFRLEAATGTLLNLAVCHEKEGRLATAWAEFKEAQVMARRDGRPDREKLAREHIAALEPKLPHLVVVVPDNANLPGLQVKRDGVQVGRAAWDIPTPVDPGPHRVEAAAPGRKTWRAVVTITVGQTRVVRVPHLKLDPDAAEPRPLELVPKAAASEPAPRATTRGWHTRWWFWTAVAGTAATVVIVSVVATRSSAPGLPNSTYGNIDLK